MSPLARALVTGGSGFLGSHIAGALSEAGWQVRLLDLIAPSEPLQEGQEFVVADVRDAGAVRRAVDGCEVVVDNAALVPISRSSRAEFRSVNVEGCRATLDAAGAEGAYVVHISSSSIYGVPAELPVTERTPVRPFEPYGESKAEAERLVQRQRERGLVVASLRSRALLGRGRLGLFELLFSRIRAGRRVPLFGNGGNVLQMCDARDFATAVLAAVARRANDDYNIGAAEYSTVRADVGALINRVGSGSRLQPIPVWAIRAAIAPLRISGRSPITEWHLRSFHAPFCAALDKAQAELGWRPSHTNVDALLAAYKHYLAGAAGGSAHSRPLRGAFARAARG